MELDDLKKNWKQNTPKKITNMDIMQLIQHKSYGPIAALKKAYKTQIVFMLLLPFILLTTSVDDISKPLTSVLFWAYVFFCMGVVVYASYNYRLVTKMEAMDGQVKQNLESQVVLLDARMKNMFTGLRIVLLVLILLTEITPYFQNYRMLTYWHSLHPLIRFGAYGLLLLFQYFVGRIILKRKFGRHIEYLKSLVKEME
jgi:hypothetical protein